MREIGSIHVFEDEAFKKRIVRWSVAVCIVGVVVLAVAYFAFPQLMGTNQLGLFASIALLLVITIITFCFHEVVHAIFFKLFAPAGSRVTFGANWKNAMLYACAEGIIFTRQQYLVAALAPTVVVTVLLLIIGAASGLLFDFCIVAVVHLSGCVGDWGYVREIQRNPAITHIEDTNFGIRFFGE